VENVASIVNQVLDARGWRGKVLEQMAVEIWPEVVGEQIARNTIAQRFKNGTLYVRARSPQWTQELHFHEARVIARLNGRLRQNLVHKIRCSVTPPRGIKVGTLKPNWEDPTFPAVPPLPRNTRPPKDDAAAKRATSIAASIEDPEMRAVMENLIAASIRAREAKTQENENNG
jgi:predicted nucleic acid-binding Zn ribbon protein